MSLRERQSLFIYLLSKLIAFAYDELGYELTGGELWRTPEQAALNAGNGTGIVKSAHLNRLAIDLNLFIDGRYCRDTESHRPLGTYWEQLHEGCRWGGHFNRKDGNHYELSQ